MAAIQLKIKYRTANSEDTKGLKNMKITMGDCFTKSSLPAEINIADIAFRSACGVL